MNTTFDDLTIVGGIPICFKPGSIIACDLEIFGADEKRLHRPTGEFASLAMTDDGKTVYFAWDLHDVIQNFEAATKDCTLVFQNAMFDIRQLRRWIPLQPRFIHDTMLLDRILWHGFFSNFSLADLSRRYLHLYMEKETRKEFGGANEMTERMTHYAAMDVASTWRIIQKQLSIARPEDLHVWKEYDMPMVWALLDFQGFPLDSEKWRVMAEANRAEADAMKLTFPFNPNAPGQVKDYFNQVEKVKRINSRQTKIAIFVI